MNEFILSTTEVTDEVIECAIEMAGFGIAYWAETAHHDEANRTYRVTPQAEFVDGTVKQTTVTYHQMAKAICDLADGTYPIRHDIRSNCALSIGPAADGGEIDSEIGDCVLQLAAFGKVIFG